MSTEETIIKKAIDLVWQNPRLDKSITIELSRLSPRNGYTDTGKIAWEVVECPTVKGYYHFYQIGDNYPGQFNLIARKNQWYRMSDWCKVINLVVHVYDQHGRMVPMDNVFTIRLYNDNLIIAILRNDKVFDLNEEKAYMHFYLNNFFGGPLKDSQVAQIEYLSSTQNKSDDINKFVDMINNLGPRLRGKYRITRNGYLVDKIDITNLEKGDVTEVHYDMSIRRIVDIPVKGLRTYKSSLDLKNKYLIHPPKDKVQEIDYRDDVDFYIYKKDKVTKEIKGTYYYRNVEDAVRMVTHQDYGLPVPYVMSHIEHIDPNPDLSEFYIRLYIRDNGKHKDLIDDVNMIKSLYTLPDNKIIEAMTMVDSTVKEWTADHLESSAYTALMRSDYGEITPALALDALGYSSIVRSIANPNINITRNPNGDYFKLPEGLQEKTITVFEYNENGLLLGWYHHRDYPKYYPVHQDTVRIEAFAGEGGDDITIHVTNKAFTLKDKTAYRFYLAETEGGIITTPFRDATNDERILIDKATNTCLFQYKDIGEIGFAQGDDKFLCWDIYNAIEDGAIDFRLTRGREQAEDILIPPGSLDIWLNGHALVENIDYYVDFPNVAVVNKEYIDHGLARQKITVRCMGFPFDVNGELKRVEPRETGFIQYGQISVNNHHDIHGDKILRTVVAGGVQDPDTLPFDELGNTKTMKKFKEGQPYSIETPYISLQASMGVSLYRSMIKDYDLTERISKYLTKHLPFKAERLPPVIEERYKVYSPFLSRIIADIKSGRLRSPLPNSSTETIEKIIQPYLKYLTIDPVYRGYHEGFVHIHAHAFPYFVNLTARDIAFLERLNRDYLEEKVDVSHFLRVNTTKD